MTPHSTSMLQDLGRQVCRSRNQVGQALADAGQVPDPYWLLSWEQLSAEQKRLDIWVGCELFQAGRQAALHEGQSRGFFELQRLLVAILSQAGPEGLLITAETLMKLPAAARICEQDTPEGKRLCLSP